MAIGITRVILVMQRSPSKCDTPHTHSNILNGAILFAANEIYSQNKGILLCLRATLDMF